PVKIYGSSEETGAVFLSPGDIIKAYTSCQDPTPVRHSGEETIEVYSPGQKTISDKGSATKSGPFDDPIATYGPSQEETISVSRDITEAAWSIRPTTTDGTITLYLIVGHWIAERYLAADDHRKWNKSIFSPADIKELKHEWKDYHPLCRIADPKLKRWVLSPKNNPFNTDLVSWW
ncbi:MAG: hypothetical protein Q9208_006550, partial [Pyrenodesmia sp. 3 TL-2023]